MKWMRHIAASGLCVAAAMAFGCASERPGDVPASADTVGDGTQQVVYTASHDGTIWVTDVNTNSIVYTGAVHADDVVTVDPGHGRLTLNGQTLSSNNINGDEHKVFFLGGPTVMAPPPTSPMPNIARPNGVSDRAMLKGEGTNLVQFTAPSNGTMWVTDSTTNNIIYSGRVISGDQVRVDPDNNTVSINGNKVSGQDLNHDNHQIFFLSNEGGPLSPGMND